MNVTLATYVRVTRYIYITPTRAHSLAISQPRELDIETVPDSRARTNRRKLVRRREGVDKRGTADLENNL